MEHGRASETAKAVAASRAVESEGLASSRIVDDPIVRKLIGARSTVVGESRLPQRLALWLHRMFMPGLHDYLVARARHIDGCVERCVANGITQLVILGAGYDTRAYRMHGLEGRVRVFEVDHPASQREKKERLPRALGNLPGHVTYVAVDLLTQTLAERLTENGYDERQPTLFVMEGVTPYLDSAAVDRTLAFVRGHSGPGSSVVFDYAYPDVVTGSFPHACARALKRATDGAGEPLRFGIEKGGVGAFLARRGFALLQDVDHAGLDAAYFSGRSDRRACPLFGIALARLAER